MDLTELSWYHTAARPSKVHENNLHENYEEVIIVENDLRVIGVIKDDEPAKESKDASRKLEAAIREGKEMEASDIETLTHLVKNLTTNVSELMKRMVKTSASSRPPKQQKRSMS